MANTVNINLNTPLGTVQIYTDPKAQARAERLISKIPSILTNGYRKGTEKFGNKLLKIVRRSLNTGKPPLGSNVSWKPHSPYTIKRYGPHLLLNLTGRYARSVTMVRTRKRTFVGLPLGRQVSYSGKGQKKTLNQIAIILEYGSADPPIPPRPLWAPAYEVAGGKEGLHKAIRDEVRKELRKYT